MTLMSTIALPETAADMRPTFDARTLTGPDGLARIILDDKVYTLRITKADKLILTK